MAERQAWELWLDEALLSLSTSKLLRSLHPLLPPPPTSTLHLQTFHGHGPWDRHAVEVHISPATFRSWLHDAPSTGKDEACDSIMPLHHDAELPHKLILFSGNDYLGLSSHPSVREAAAKAALEFGMGPRGSPLICGYTCYHRLLETALADLKKTEESLLCPSGFAANLAVLMTINSSASISTISDGTDTIAIFSDALNHASIIDGVLLAKRQNKADVYVYRHRDMNHLDQLLSSCKNRRKVVVTDSLFSMDGDYAPMSELVALRRKHRFLFILDDAHGTLVCGQNGGGVAEAFDVEGEVDITVGTLSKAFGCQGGFIACSQKWKKLIQSRGRSFVFSTALPIPTVAAAHAALHVAREEKWRRDSVWQRVQQLSDATSLTFKSPIAPIIIGEAPNALKASRALLLKGFHVSAIRPPSVPASSSRLRITLSASHTTEDVKALSIALQPLITSSHISLLRSASNLEDIEEYSLVSHEDRQSADDAQQQLVQKHCVAHQIMRSKL